MLRINVKKVLFILLCAELMFIYYGQLEVKESRSQVIQGSNSGESEPSASLPGLESPPLPPTELWMKAS
ncbi:hypothetical protein [Paenibacillus silviterrae]|uniref:hypothetical protein n=1 Tax=Paenibacillus silviterrae TaxID=3242194 RepID=UPI00254333B7|nr:hypothetical protein [Paenibacillus chinjuensis]